MVRFGWVVVVTTAVLTAARAPDGYTTPGGGTSFRCRLTSQPGGAPTRGGVELRLPDPRRAPLNPRSHAIDNGSSQVEDGSLQVGVEPVFVIGLRLSPERTDPDLYTAWFEEGDSGKSVVARLDGRLQWATSYESIVEIRDSTCDLAETLDGLSELNVVCSIPALLYAITNPLDADWPAAYLAVDLLGDLVYSTSYPLPNCMQGALDRLSVGLFEEVNMPVLVNEIGSDVLVEGVLSSLGRILCFSDYV